jgi:hypothetical protein
MSDSLLTLLEIMDQVVQEEELKEQASGAGAPTEQELRNAITPNLAKLCKDQEIADYEDYNEEDFKKDLGVAFDALYKLVSKDSNLVRDKIEYLANWLDKLNYFHLENPDAGYAFGNQPEVIDSLINSLGIGPGKNSQFRDELFDQFIKKPLFLGIKQGKRTNLQFTQFITNLKKGIGVIAISRKTATGGSGSNPATAAESEKILDINDYKELEKELLNKQPDMLYPFLNLAAIENQNLAEPLKKIHIKYLETYLKKAFESINSSPDVTYFVMLKKIFAWIQNKNIKNQKNINANEKAGNTIKKVETLPSTFQQFFKNQYELYSKKYKELLQKSDSGETFTSPESIDRKTINNEAVQAIVKEFFKDFNDKSIEGRIKHLTEKMNIFKSKDISSEIQKQKINSLDFINRVLMMEYFIKFSKQFAASGAGTLFEYFLAALFGGTATGERGDAVDFEVQSGGEIKLGSAKFLAPTSAIRPSINSQKISTFLPFVGKTITYVLAIKKESDTRISQDKITPLELTQVDIYTFKVRYEGEENLYVNDGEKPRPDLVTKDGNFSFVKLFSNNEMEYIGTLQIMSTSEEGIHGFRQLVLKSVNEQTKNLLQAIQELFDHIKDADTKARKYVSSGDKFDGFDAQTALREADGSISELNTQSGDYEDTSKVRRHWRRPAR